MQPYLQILLVSPALHFLEAWVYGDLILPFSINVVITDDF